MTPRENMSQRYFNKVQAALPDFDLDDLIKSHTQISKDGIFR